MGADGTLTYELPAVPADGAPVGTYPQIFANTANLDGTLVANIQPANGLFDDTTLYDNVIDANDSRTARSTSCVHRRRPDADRCCSTSSCVYDAKRQRRPRASRGRRSTQVAGLNGNGRAVGDRSRLLSTTSA